MTQPAPAYTTPPHPGALPARADMPTPDVHPSLWVVYLQRRREAIIMELRALDRALGRPQTIPERQR